MSFPIFLLTLFASIAYSQFTVNDSSTAFIEKLDELATGLQQKCKTSFNSSLHKELQNSADNFEKCMIKFARMVFVNDCEKSTEELITCINSIANVWKECLDPNGKYLPDLIDNLESQMLNTLCESDFIADLLLLGMSLNTCTTKLNIFQNSGKNSSYLNKTIVCSDLEIWGNCLITFYEDNCKVPADIFAFMQPLYDAYRSYCNFAETNITNFVRVIALLTLLQVFSFLLKQT